MRLTEENYKGYPVVTVGAILNTELVLIHGELRIGAIVVQVGSEKCEGLPLAKIAELILSSSRPISIKFRDPSRYFELLDSSTPGPIVSEITTSYLPANTRILGLPEQIIRVERQAMPSAQDRIRSSQLLV